MYTITFQKNHSIPDIKFEKTCVKLKRKIIIRKISRYCDNRYRFQKLINKISDFYFYLIYLLQINYHV